MLARQITPTYLQLDEPAGKFNSPAIAERDGSIHVSLRRSVGQSFRQRENYQWSLYGKLCAYSAFLLFTTAASAQQLDSPGDDLPGFWLSRAWNYFVEHPPLAVMLSTLIVSAIALRSIASQREMTRLRETFATVDRGNWDKDVIASRQHFKEIRVALDANKETIAKFAKPTTKQEIRAAITLNTILNDYENLALGVRKEILDENYLHRWMRGAILQDWEILSPLVTAYRTLSLASSNAYVEFEGLATSWQRDESYSGRGKIVPARRVVKVE